LCFGVYFTFKGSFHKLGLKDTGKRRNILKINGESAGLNPSFDLAKDRRGFF
jgi:hypothetical protein